MLRSYVRTILEAFVIVFGIYLFISLYPTKFLFNAQVIILILSALVTVILDIPRLKCLVLPLFMRVSVEIIIGLLIGITIMAPSSVWWLDIVVGGFFLIPMFIILEDTKIEKTKKTNRYLVSEFSNKMLEEKENSILFSPISLEEAKLSLTNGYISFITDEKMAEIIGNNLHISVPVFSDTLSNFRIGEEDELILAKYEGRIVVDGISRPEVLHYTVSYIKVKIIKGN